VFVAQFLDPEFVNRELFHYRALNQQTILMWRLWWLFLFIFVRWL
jgi:hypothetical protein